MVGCVTGGAIDFVGAVAVSVSVSVMLVGPPSLWSFVREIPETLFWFVHPHGGGCLDEGTVARPEIGYGCCTNVRAGLGIKRRAKRSVETFQGVKIMVERAHPLVLTAATWVLRLDSCRV